MLIWCFGDFGRLVLSDGPSMGSSAFAGDKFRF
jgi:hypothetical protein